MKAVKKLEQITNLRAYWSNEAHHFTPWLVKNIELLSEATGINLEVVEREAHMGCLSVDILCRDGITGERVIVENQIESSNFEHLGKVLAYLSRAGATCAIWVAPSFKSEHLEAIRWLNNNTESAYSFYAVSYKLYKIEGSNAGVQFFTIVAPEAQSKSSISSEQSDRNRLQLEFWTGLEDYINSGLETPFRTYKPSPRSYMDIPLGSPIFHIVVRITTRSMTVQLYIDGEDAKNQYDRLFEAFYEDSLIQLGSNIIWERNDGKRASMISITENANPYDSAEWTNCYGWIVNQVLLFMRFFRKYI